MSAAVPRLDDHLPELCAFVRTLAHQIEAGELHDGDELTRLMRSFFTADRMAAIEVVAPGWKEMAAYADGATLHHVTQALIALELLPEYRQASPHLQGLMAWCELYHDIGKQVISGQRDALHAFRGATMVARTLPRIGFQVSEAYPVELERWIQLVRDSCVDAPDGKGMIPDNRALPAVLQGIEQLFGAGSAAALILQSVLLHQSLNVVPEWPNPAGLAEDEYALCIRPSVLPLLEAVMLVDSDAWQLFDPASRTKFRQSTLAAFAVVRQRVLVA